ncbi:NAD P-binding protein [Gloeophyllum trabeum ATCC 11539]|uniref:NAD P-binding protein n=1 Tax=Gloeophyllum trabeum (strain ATCC 11539 / FP-39264 / Madison 617) TaxID=670483 RepID=S7PTU5_GLOTA|nr:NAD P-binding protein [Gloeophyllum trabeum ATCC 11539]EPQ50868.1 NAD P-binding protein [Gloeophyllum trabeum ATCC 11539]
MKVFVTGAAGHVGSALIPKLVASGHQVTGLIRSPSSIAKLESLGAKPVQGDLTDLETIAKASKDADIVVHLAFDHGMAFGGDFAGACEKDRKVIEAICNALLSSNSGGEKKRFILASGTLGLPPGGNEESEGHRSPQLPRHLSTDLAFSYAPKGLSVIALRLAPVTYGPAEPHSFLKQQIAQIEEKGYVAYPDSDNAWGACTIEDVADLFLRAVEIAPGKLPNPATLHGLAESVPLKDVAEVLGRRLGKETKVIPKEKLAEELGFVGVLQSMAYQASAEWTKEQTGWKPKGKRLLEQLELYEIA